MASISINIDDIRYAYVGEDAQEGEFEEALNNIAGIIESAIENAFSTEGSVEIGGLIDVSVDAD